MTKPTPFSVALGGRIAARREALVIDRMQLAHAVAVHLGTVGGWERGEVQPAPPQLVRLAAALGVTVDWLLSGGEAPAPGARP